MCSVCVRVFAQECILLEAILPVLSFFIIEAIMTLVNWFQPLYYPATILNQLSSLPKVFSRLHGLLQEIKRTV